MTREEALQRLRPMESELRASGVMALYLFGSTARGDAREDSDVDLACEIDAAFRMGLLQFAGIQINLEAMLGSKVDLVEREMLRPRVRAHAETEMARVF
jgi:uncharacterized protein